MDFLARALASIPEAAQSPLGTLLLIVIVAAWFTLAWKVRRNKALLQKIESFPANQRQRVYELETGQPYLKGGMTAEQWTRAQIHKYFFYAFVATLVAIVVLIWPVISPTPIPQPLVRVEGPRLFDLRSQMDPSASSALDAQKSEALLTLLAVSYENSDETTKRARVLEQDATLKLGQKIFSYRWFQFADLSKTGKGWLGAVGDAAPFAIEPGQVAPLSTQFKSRTPVTWEQMLEALSEAKDGELVLSSRIAGLTAGSDVLIQSSCIPDLEKARRDTAEVLKKLGRPPIYVQVLCKNLPR